MIDATVRPRHPLDHADELSRRFEDYEPAAEDERDVETFEALRGALIWRGPRRRGALGPGGCRAGAGARVLVGADRLGARHVGRGGASASTAPNRRCRQGCLILSRNDLLSLRVAGRS